MAGRAIRSFGLTYSQFFALKVDPVGSVEWTALLGGDMGEVVHGAAADGSLYLAGWSESFGTGGADFGVAKLNPDGSLAWMRGYGGGSGDYAEDLIVTSDGGVLVVGDTYSFGAGGHDFLVVKLSSDGSVEWAKAYGGITNDAAASAVQTPDGGYIVVGKTAKSSFNEDILVLKLGPDGTLRWAKAYGGSSDEWAYSAALVGETLLVAGRTFSFGPGGSGAFLMALDTAGNLLWAKSYGSTGYEHAQEIVPTSDGGLLVAGWTTGFGASYTDFLAFKVDAAGSPQWCFTLGGDSSDYAYDALELPGGDIAVFGQVYAYSGAPGGCDFTLLRMGPDGSYEGCVTPCELQVVEPSLTLSTPSVQTTSLSLSPQTASISFSQPAVQTADLCEPLGGTESPCRRGPALVPARGGLRLVGGPADVRVFFADGRLALRARLSEGELVQLKPGVYLWEANGRRGAAAVRP